MANAALPQPVRKLSTSSCKVGEATDLTMKREEPENITKYHQDNIPEPPCFSADISTLLPSPAKAASEDNFALETCPEQSHVLALTKSEQALEVPYCNSLTSLGALDELSEDHVGLDDEEIGELLQDLWDEDKPPGVKRSRFLCEKCGEEFTYKLAFSKHECRHSSTSN